MSKTVSLTKAQITTILSCINDRESKYLQEIEVHKDNKEHSRMITGYKKRIATIRDIQDLLGYKRFPGRL